MNYFLGRNLLPKLLAVLVALILWVFVMNEQNPPVEGTFQVSLTDRKLDCMAACTRAIRSSSRGFQTRT